MNDGKGTQAIFLDRDGVINEVVFRAGKPASPRLLTEFQFCEGIIRTLEPLAKVGFRIFVVSNQPDVARDLLEPATLEEMTHLILARLPVERVLTCIHDDTDGCNCRKPKPGMMHRVASEEVIDLSRSFIIGDSWKDVQAGRSAGCTTILLRRNYNHSVEADYVVESVSQAVDLIMRRVQHGNPNDAIRNELPQ